MRYVPAMVLAVVAAFVLINLDIDPEHPHPALAATAPTAEVVTSTSSARSVPLAEEPFVHVVVAGDRLDSIATTYNVTMDAILTANPEVDPDLLQIGQQLLVPGATTVGPTPTAAPDVRPRTAPAPDELIRHVVAEGERLVGLAQQYGVPVEHIVAYNQLTDDRIFVGQRLLVPPASLEMDH